MKNKGAWVAQSVELPTSAQVMISQLVGLSPDSCSVLTVQSLLGTLSLSPCLSAPPLLALSLSQKKKKRISYFWLLCKYRSLSAGGRLCFLMEVSSLAFKGADSGYAALQITAFA